MVRDPKNIGANVRRLRIAKGLTQQGLASRADVADPTISRIERGRLEPSSTLISKLATALGSSVDDLLGKSKLTKPTFRPSITRLVGVVEDLDDGAVDDVTKAVRLILAAGKRSVRQR